MDEGARFRNRALFFSIWGSDLSSLCKMILKASTAILISDDRLLCKTMALVFFQEQT
jgi:hypothetical protein